MSLAPDQPRPPPPQLRRVGAPVVEEEKARLKVEEDARRIRNKRAAAARDRCRRGWSGFPKRRGDDNVNNDNGPSDPEGHGCEVAVCFLV